MHCGCIKSFVKADEHFEARSLIVGNPAKKIKEVSDAMIGLENGRHKTLPAVAKRYVGNLERSRTFKGS
jgi:carbonic anhydrase/acetyltransferase-like protein (isoleucine patch superfamily)